MPVFKVSAYKHFFVKPLVQISTSTEVNHFISKELYQKQNGFKFIWEIALMKIDFHYGDELLISEHSKRKFTLLIFIKPVNYVQGRLVCQIRAGGGCMREDCLK